MERWEQGSFTVEAAMIMGIVLLVILSVLEGSRFVYERSMQTAREYEIAISEGEEDPSPVTYIRRTQLIKNAAEKR